MLAALALGALRRHAAIATPMRAASSLPRVSSHVVNLTLVLPDGTRRPLRGLAGTPLVNLLVDSADALAAHPSPDAFHPPPPLALSPAGRGAPDAVVEVPAEVAALVPPPTGDDARALEELALAVKPSTRLASAVTLDAAFDGATLALSGVRPWATL